MRFDTQAFVVFKAVIEEQSFAKAAKRLNIAQSAVSYQIKQLESQLNLNLFDRSRYRAQLTETGQAVWQEAQSLFTLMDNIQTIGQRASSGWENQLDIVVEGALPQLPILQALQHLDKENIPTKIRLRTEFLGGVQEQFEQANADIMLVLHHQTSPKLRAYPLAPLHLCLVASQAHPLSQLSEVTDDDLLKHTELVVQDTSQRLTMAKGLAPVTSDSLIFLSNFQTKKQALLMGLGYGWIPQQLIEQALQDNHLAKLNHIHCNTQCLHPKLVHRVNRPLGKAGHTFCRQIQQQLIPTDIPEFNEHMAQIKKPLDLTK